MYEQDRVYVRLQQNILRKQSVVVAFVSGSYGRRTQDDFSDLDVTLVFADDNQRELAYAKRKEFIQGILPYVPAKSFDADHIRPYLHIALFSNGTKVDLRYETQAELQPNPFDKEIRILKDSNGWAERYQEACAMLALPQPIISTDELTNLDSRFWVMFWDVYRQVKRGNLSKPFPVYVQLFDLTILRFLEVLPHEDVARKGLLIMRYGGADGDVLAHLRGLFQAYLTARSAIIRRYRLGFMPNSSFENSVKQLIER
jgi:predicted nucleotidyltransferase